MFSEIFSLVLARKSPFRVALLKIPLFTSVFLASTPIGILHWVYYILDIFCEFIPETWIMAFVLASKANINVPATLFWTACQHFKTTDVCFRKLNNGGAKRNENEALQHRKLCKFTTLRSDWISEENEKRAAGYTERSKAPTNDRAIRQLIQHKVMTYSLLPSGHFPVATSAFCAQPHRWQQCSWTKVWWWNN